MTNSMKDLPNVWGAGQLMAFSGLDGPTDWFQPFILHTGRQPGSLDIKLPLDIQVAFNPLPKMDISVILNDVIIAEASEGIFQCAFSDHHTLIGEIPSGTRMFIDNKVISGQPKCVGTGMGMSIWAATEGTRWALMAAAENTDIFPRWEKILKTDLNEVIQSRLAFVQGIPLPKGISPSRTRLLRKAVSVIKVNIEAPCGTFHRLWTTPDRWPHRNMWLWDSAFHGIGLSYVAPSLAKEILLSMLEQASDDGMLPLMSCPNGQRTSITQPPILAWSILNVLQKTHDHSWAKECTPYLYRYLEWIRANRDKNNNHLPEWKIERAATCRSGESGLDNSPRFDRHDSIDAVDFAGFLSNDYQCLAQIAAQIGDEETRCRCIVHAQTIADAVNQILWRESEGFYFDRTFDGTWIPVKAVSGFCPLFAGIADRNQAEAMRKHLRNPQTFGAAFPVPSVSLDSGTFCKDMWRGPTWINFNYLIYLGLLKYGFYEDAKWLKEKILVNVEKWYLQEGCLFEFYDALDLTSPCDLERKQRLRSGQGIGPISDYHWTAAVVTALIFDQTGC